MKKSILDRQVQELRELRSRLQNSPVTLDSPNKGLRVVAQPSKQDRLRLQRRQATITPKLASKLQGFKVA